MLLLVIVYFCLFSAGWWRIWPGDELYYPGCWEHNMHDRAVGALRRDMSSWNMEHVHSHSAKKCSESADKHGSWADWTSIAENECSWWHDSRYEVIQQENIS